MLAQDPDPCRQNVPTVPDRNSVHSDPQHYCLKTVYFYFFTKYVFVFIINKYFKCVLVLEWKLNSPYIIKELRS